MYIDLIVIGGILIASLVFFKKFSSFVFVFGMMDILLRIIYFIRTTINIAAVTKILKVVPASISVLASSYVSGVILTIINCLFAFLYLLFDIFVFQYFMHKRK